MGKAIQDLNKEHEAVLYVLKILEEMMVNKSEDKESKRQYYNEVIYFLKTFVDKCHHGKEENFLFEELTANGVLIDNAPISVMLKEHTQGRDYISKMSEHLDANNIDMFVGDASEYIDLLRSHIEKENNVLFVLADKILSEETQEKLFEKFEEFEEEVIGNGIHEKLHSMIDKWAEVFDAK